MSVFSVKVNMAEFTGRFYGIFRFLWHIFMSVKINMLQIYMKLCKKDILKYILIHFKTVK